MSEKGQIEPEQQRGQGCNPRLRIQTHRAVKVEETKKQQRRIQKFRKDQRKMQSDKGHQDNGITGIKPEIQAFRRRINPIGQVRIESNIILLVIFKGVARYQQDNS